MPLVADLGADGAHSGAVHQLAGVAVVPVLVHELALGHHEGAQLLVQGFVLLRKEIATAFR